MSLHRLTGITLGVPNVAETIAYYTEFGLSLDGAAEGNDSVSTVPKTHVLSTVDGGRQLEVVSSPRRRLKRLGVGAQDLDDIERVAHNLTLLGIDVRRSRGAVSAVDPGTQVEVTVEVADALQQEPKDQVVYNRPGRPERDATRADGVLRTERVRPRKLGHVVVGSTDQAFSERFFTEGLGFKVSDSVKGMASFLRCSTDHHNVLIQQAPLAFLHHTSWQVDDVDEVGRGATAMLEVDPDRHVWGLGRHHIGSNFFWYLKDPAGNFSEYYSDLDCIVEDALWTPGDWEGMKGLYNWGPPPPPSFLQPEDLAALMTGAHQPG